MRERPITDRSKRVSGGFVMPEALRAPCDGCGKLKTREELTVVGIYAFCGSCKTKREAAP